MSTMDLARALGGKAAIAKWDEEYELDEVDAIFPGLREGERLEFELRAVHQARTPKR